jgi:hypothetical protein
LRSRFIARMPGLVLRLFEVVVDGRVVGQPAQPVVLGVIEVGSASPALVLEEPGARISIAVVDTSALRDSVAARRTSDTR